MKTLDIEKINRNNFKALMNALSMPGSIHTIEQLFSSNILAIANTLLYSEVEYFYEGEEDMSLIEAITFSKKASNEKADYIFADCINENLFLKTKKGTSKDPEFSGTLIFKCQDFNKGSLVELSGPGINISKRLKIPLSKSFIAQFNQKNEFYPLGNEIILVSEEGSVMAFSRTTKIKVI